MKIKTNNLTLRNRTNKGMMPYQKRVSLKHYKKRNKKYKKKKMINRLTSWKK